MKITSTTLEELVFALENKDWANAALFSTICLANSLTFFQTFSDDKVDLFGGTMLGGIISPSMLTTISDRYTLSSLKIIIKYNKF